MALVFHQHQPAGNFPSVFSEVTERAYAPLVAALYRHPEVKASLHFSGPLLDWLEANRPDVIGDLSDLVRRGQIELLSGGYYEPVLVGVTLAVPLAVGVLVAGARLGWLALGLDRGRTTRSGPQALTTTTAMATRRAP